jgi:hypothetical protein
MEHAGTEPRQGLTLEWMRHVTRYVRPGLQLGPFDVKRKGSWKRVRNLGKDADGTDFVIKPYVHATVLAEDRRHCPSRLAEARNIPPSLM